MAASPQCGWHLRRRGTLTPLIITKTNVEHDGWWSTAVGWKLGRGAGPRDAAIHITLRVVGQAPVSKFQAALREIDGLDQAVR
jgi:hypothetical protein